MGEATLRADLNSVCAEIYDRWDKDQRSGKLLSALAGELRKYDPRTTRIRAAIENHDDLLTALQRIAQPLDCGCVPCRGQCRSQVALECEVEERQDIARAALAKAQGQ